MIISLTSVNYLLQWNACYLLFFVLFFSAFTHIISHIKMLPMEKSVFSRPMVCRSLKVLV